MADDVLMGQRQFAVPVMDRRHFADQCGLTVETVEAMCSRGYLPTVKVGRRSFINVALLNQRCLNAKY